MEIKPVRDEQAYREALREIAVFMETDPARDTPEGDRQMGDTADRARLDAVIAQYRPEAVTHFAAYAYVGESVQDPAKYYRNNVAGTLTLLEALVHHHAWNGHRQQAQSSSVEREESRVNLVESSHE